MVAYRSTRLLVVAALASALAATHPCTEPTQCRGTARDGVRDLGEPYQVWLTWRCDADRAAAALLLRLLSAGGHCRLRLCYAPRGPCDLHARRPSASLEPKRIVVGVEENEVPYCTGYGNDTTALMNVGRDAAPAPAPVHPRLHVRLDARAAGRAACAAAVTPLLYERPDDAIACGFSYPLRYYVPREWNDAPRPTSLDSLAGLERRVCTRAELVRKVISSNASFLFVDAEVWGELESVGVVRAAFPYARSSSGAALRAPLLRLERRAPNLLRALRDFEAPDPRRLRELLSFENETEPAGERALSAVDEWAKRHSSDFEKMRERLSPRAQVHYAAVFMCDSARASDEAFLKKVIDDALWNVTRDARVDIRTLVVRIDCLDPSRLREELERKTKEGLRHRLLGAAVAGAGVAEAADFARRAGLPLVAYDVQPLTDRLLAVGARAEDAARALLVALAACRWRRVALISEDAPTAKRVAEALLSELGPSAVEERLSRGESEASVGARLRALRSRDARVFVVNAGDATAARVLAAAHAAGLTDCAWVMRQWGHATPPLSMLALRLGAPTPTPPPPGAAWWPSGEAPPLAHALMTLAVVFLRTLRVDPETRFDSRSEKITELFRRQLAELPSPPPLRLERWLAGRTEPEQYYNTSAGDECHAPSPRPADGSVRCDLPYGSSFSPHCLDAAVACAAPSLLLAALVAGHGCTAWRRRARARRAERARRVRAEAAADLVVRQGECVAALVPWLVERDTVREVRPLGAGRFGRVWLAALGAGRYAAAKEPHAGTGPGEEAALLLEAAMLARLRHDRVVRLLGVCVGGGAPLALTEPAFFGDLRGYLRARRPLLARASLSDEARHVSDEALTRMAREAALALAYLARCRVVHCDVRAANCLVDERRSLKLADFGMARSTSDGGGGGDGVSAAGGEYACRRRAIFPVLWMAPESLKRGVFSHASDVWALGVLALELVTLGARPFGALEARDAVELVVRGGRARLPLAASAHTRALARACWRREASARPAASALAAWLAERPGALRPALDAYADLRADDDDGGFAKRLSPSARRRSLEEMPSFKRD